MEKEIDLRAGIRSNKDRILSMLDKTIENNDYMTLVTLQLKIQNGYYEDFKPEDAEKDIKFLSQYKRSYPHISSQIEEIIDYLNSLVVMYKIEGN